MDHDKRIVQHILKERGGVEEITLTHGFTLGKGGNSSLVLPGLKGEGRVKFLVIGIWVVMRIEEGEVDLKVNGENVKGERILKSGDSIEVGGKEFLFETLQDDITAARTRLFTVRDVEKFVHFMKREDEREEMEKGKEGTLILDSEDVGKGGEEGAVEPKGDGTIMADLSPLGGGEGEGVPVGGETMVFEGEALKVYPYLFLLSDKGGIVEYPLRGDEIRVGRAGDNHIVLSHETVSSHHMRIVVEKKRVLIKDLNSTNGTFLNGKRVMEEELHHGDLLEVGDLRFVFAESGRGITLPGEEEKGPEKGVPPAKIRPKPAGKRVLLYGVLGILVLCGAILFLIPEKGEEIPAAPEGAVPPPPKEEAPPPTDPLTLAKDTFSMRDWEALLSMDGAVKEGDPSYQEFRDLIEKAALEIKNRDTFILLGQKLKEGRVEEASTLAGSIPAGSIYHEEAKREMERYRREKITPLQEEAEKLKGEGRFEEALAKIEEILVVDPGYGPALTMKGEVEETLNKRRAAYAALAMQKRRLSAFQERFIHLYTTSPAGKIVEAILEEKSKGKIPKDAVTELNDMLTAATLYREGENLKARGSTEGAVRKFEEFLNVDRRISGAGGGLLRSGATSFLSSHYTRKGEEYLSAMDYKKSARNFKSALSLDRNNREARAGLKKIEGKAEELFQDGYVFMKEYGDCQKASMKFRQVLELIPEESPLYGKAKDSLSKCR